MTQARVRRGRPALGEKEKRTVSRPLAFRVDEIGRIVEAFKLDNLEWPEGARKVLLDYADAKLNGGKNGY